MVEKHVSEPDATENSQAKAQRDMREKSEIYYNMTQERSGLAEELSNWALGQNVLREEIGYFGPYGGTTYQIDQNTRDVLLAHSRQDAAAAAAMARSAYRQAHSAKSVAVRAVRLLYGSLALNIVIIGLILMNN